MGFFDLFRKAQPSDEEGRTRTAPPSSVTVVPRSEVAGRLDALPDYLPDGQFVLPERGETPIAWLLQEGDLRALWARLVADFPSTGLWPVVAGGLYEEIDRPWLDREFGGPGTGIGEVADVLRRALWDAEEYPNEDGEDWRYEFAGLAAGTPSGGSTTLPTPGEITALALVPVTRPADVPAQLGWWGPTNHDLSGGDVTTVLRSWEDRFGAVLTHLGFDTLVLSVAHPPAGAEQAGLLAREYYLFCPDSIDQGVQSLEWLAEAVLEKEWYFWWD